MITRQIIDNLQETPFNSIKIDPNALPEQHEMMQEDNQLIVRVYLVDLRVINDKKSRPFH